MQNSNQNEIAYFTMPKVGEQKSDIEDAYSFSSDHSLVAIADGTSTSFLAGEWAKLLVEHFCSPNESSISEIGERWEEWLRPLQQEWRKRYLKIKTDKNIPWNAKGGDKAHGSATFVGLKLQPPNQGGEKIWEALAVGDSCLFQIKPNSGELISFPITNYQEFTTVTKCFHSLPDYKSHQPLHMKGSYELGDIFLLATDALAKWILTDYHIHQSHRWQDLISVDEEGFINLINQLRGDKLIEDDDTTLLRLVVIVESQTTKPPNGDHPDPNRPNPGNKKNLLFIIIVALLAIGCVGTVIYLSIFNNKQNYNANQHQNYPANKVTTPKQPTPTVKTSPTSNNSNPPNYQILTIYSDESNNRTTIGYVFKKASDLQYSQQLWVHVPKAYLYKEETDKFIMTIPDDATPLALYIDKPEPEDLSPQDFAGYLLPGKYSVFKPRNSKTFNDARWVKVNFSLENKGG